MIRSALISSSERVAVYKLCTYSRGSAVVDVLGTRAPGVSTIGDRSGLDGLHRKVEDEQFILLFCLDVSVHACAPRKCVCLGVCLGGRVILRQRTKLSF